MKSLTETNKCPVCGQSELEEFDICPICGWENDFVQFGKPDYSGGANKMNVNEAKAAYAQGKPIE